MAEFVLDASVAISWCFPGDPSEDNPYSRHILNELLVRDALVPEIWGTWVGDLGTDRTYSSNFLRAAARGELRQETEVGAGIEERKRAWIAAKVSGMSA